MHPESLTFTWLLMFANQEDTSCILSCKPPQNAGVQWLGLSTFPGSPSLYILYQRVNVWNKSRPITVWTNSKVQTRKMWTQRGLICLPIKPTRTNLRYLSTQRRTTLFYPDKTARGLRHTQRPLWHRYKVSMLLLTKRSVWHHLATPCGDEMVELFAIIAIHSFIHFEIDRFSGFLIIN